MIEFTEINFWDIKKNETYVNLINKILKKAFYIEKIEMLNLYVNIILTNEENIKSINEKYRNINKETDVLSFPMFEKNEIENMKENGNEVKEVLGDIIISMPQVKKQSEEYEHSFERELAYMVVHGFYHLMGYDHMEELDKAQMREKEEGVLRELNITK